ncbi:hypothetical protein PHYSODRAFT_328060 [Phytophthora sojae]|uniref:DNA replication complex GINS protein PSF2 n=1 Tax=Phytophthora sojae (strain P6497) TaxID=1094619 RepID=G4ZBG3_PHYSP|nr:hypothetical protein PHYSODRAFT_328060 [Phytophthora sojae]EGZ19885.1 hypothetical protein PHYSODRAFT_328060 [Phytophthora sojae]|eukprot:XP_009522602.1 hypothetical protein PHYSODRAFT_328060 [Phytophthora sojae]
MASLSASETEFLAEQELIAILPHFHLRDNNGMLNFISGDFGPFQPGITTHVPLWLAIMLKQLNKCRILAPSWLSVDYLMSRLEREKASDAFEELPFHYLEVASLLLKNAPEDLDQGEHLRSLLEDLQNVRQDKIRNGLSRIAGDVVQSGGSASVIQMNNISALEINSVREFMIGSLNQFYRLSRLNAEDDEDLSQSQSQSQTQNYSEPPSGMFANIVVVRRQGVF